MLTAGVDTTSTTLSRILWLLADRQDVQDKLREEFTLAHETGKELDYDYLQNLPFLEAIIRETLRLYVPLALDTIFTSADYCLHVAFLQFRSLSGRERSVSIAVDS